MLIAYASAHGYGHLTRLCEVLRAVRERAPRLPLAVVAAAPEALVRSLVPGPFEHRNLAADVGLAQRDALAIDEPATAARCLELEASWDARVEIEVAFLRGRGARLVLGDVPALAFAAAARAGVPSVGLTNFSWDWIYRHLAIRHPSLAASADRAAAAYGTARLLLELPFAGDLSAFPRREEVGFVARRPRVSRAAARRLLGLDGRPAVLLSFGGVGLPWLTRALAGVEPGLRLLLPEELGEERLAAAGLGYPDVVGAVDVVVTKPGYGIVTDAIAAGTRVVYTERGDFPEYQVMVAEMPRYLACAHLSNEELRAGRIAGPVRRVLELPVPARPDLGGAERAASRLLEIVERKNTSG
jgi:L-arabinokinase